MKKTKTKPVKGEAQHMRPEYDFRKGVRGKHHSAMQAGYIITVYQADGTTIVKDVMPKEGAVILEPDVRAYFPDSKSVNRTLRCLIPLLQRKRGEKVKKA